MYATINKAIEELVVEQYGRQRWDSLINAAGIRVGISLSTDRYNEAFTNQLTEAVAVELNTTPEEIMMQVGEWWLLQTSRQKFGSLIKTIGGSVKEFLLNLPGFQTRLLLICPQLDTPEFRVSRIEDHSIYLQCLTSHQGLRPFLKGLIYGLGKFYQTPVTIDLVASEERLSEHDEFKISWK